MSLLTRILSFEAGANGDGGLDVELAIDDLAADRRRLLSGAVAEVIDEAVFLCAVGGEVGARGDH